MEQNTTQETGSLFCEGSPGSFATPTRLIVRRLRENELQLVVELNKRVFDIETADEADLTAAFHHNPDNLWAVVKTDGANEQFVGYYAFLMLNRQGHARLLARRLDRRRPPGRPLGERRACPRSRDAARTAETRVSALP